MDMQTYLNSVTKANATITYCDAITLSFNNAQSYAFKASSAVIKEVVWLSILFGVFIALILYVLIKTIQQTLMVNGYVNYISKNPEKAASSVSDDLEYVSPQSYTPPKDEDPFR